MTATATDRRSDVGHEASGPPRAGDLDSFPSHAELTRTLLEGGGLASLATLSTDGHPFTSTVPISIDDDGAPIMCVSALAEHTRNLRRDPRASVLVHESADVGVDPLALARVAVVGSFRPIGAGPSTIGRHVEAHPHAANYVHFDDFSWRQMDVAHVRFVGGFGVMGWASAADVRAAEADPVIPSSARIVTHLNDEHADACRTLVRSLVGLVDAESATVTHVDRYGLTMSVSRSDGPTTIARIRFADAPLHGPDDVGHAMVALVQRSRSMLGNES